MTQSLNYAKSGVDINQGNEAVNLIKDKAEKTLKYFPGKILSGIGGFSGIVELSDHKVMGCATDGVGTKLIIGIVLDEHNTVTDIKKTIALVQKGDQEAEKQLSDLYELINKIDVHEEIVRFKSHLNSVKKILVSKQLEKGKRFEFVLQELGRETNTIAAMM